MLDYERLDAYQCALQFAALAFEILETLPRGHSQLADQLRRATISMPLNIAEGVGKTSDKDRRRFHAIARGSAMECGAILDIMRIQNLLPDAPTQAAKAKELLVRVVSMLTKMTQ
jgi:four helix bundle protein